MNGETYHIGDIVQIREWDDMKSEFGVNSVGNILCPSTFIHEMRQYCGTSFAVRGVDGKGDSAIYSGHQCRRPNNGSAYVISGAMLQLYSPQEVNVSQIDCLL